MNCGFENVHFSFGHDEYLAAVFRRSNSMGMSKLPREMIYMINFHSFYAWHSPRKHSRGYTYLASKDDWLMLPLLKALKLADLYSKSRNVPNMDILTK
jgi:inositol oxygenase